jgi:hypothetical protein
VICNTAQLNNFLRVIQGNALHFQGKRSLEDAHFHPAKENAVTRYQAAIG